MLKYRGEKKGGGFEISFVLSVNNDKAGCYYKD
jgi:hypothetical protein